MPSVIIKQIKVDHIELLKHFLATIGDSAKSFRYFTNRPLTIIDNHLLTLLAFSSEGVPVGYGHLDPEDDKIWLGICVAEKQQGKGVGKKILSRLLLEASNLGINTVTLSVDEENRTAIALYKKYGFVLIEKLGKVCFFQRCEQNNVISKINLGQNHRLKTSHS